MSQVLLAKAKVEAEDAQRMLFGALNGIAALLLLDRNPADAIALYRQVISHTASCQPDGSSADVQEPIRMSAPTVASMHHVAGACLPGS